MERMSKFPYAFMFLEFGIDDASVFPVNSTIPQSKWGSIRVKGPFIMKKISEIQVDYGIHVVFCGDVDNARWMATNVMKRVYAQFKPD
jgi:hypothetical protein